MISEKTNKKGNGRGVQWLRAHLNYAETDCLIWPFNTSNGYGIFGLNGSVLYAHRWVCEQMHGPTPSPAHEAAHSCGRGHQGCVNPRHISWKTKSENQADRARHGTKSIWGARGKLTPAQASQIRALKGQKTQAEIAAMFNTSRANVSFIHCGKAWAKERKGYQKSGKKFRARIRINNRDFSLGTFATAEEAHAAWIEANNKARKRQFAVSD